VGEGRKGGTAAFHGARLTEAHGRCIIHVWSQLRAKQPAPSCRSLQCFYNNEQPNHLQRLLAPPPPPFHGTYCCHLSCRHFWEAICVARRATRLLPRSCCACSNAHCQLLPLPPSVPVGACLLPSPPFLTRAHCSPSASLSLRSDSSRPSCRPFASPTALWPLPPSTT